MARLNKYEILRPLASGGMAEVHLARTTGPHGIEKLLVIKRLLPELAANKQFVRMFLDEARLAVALDHANIVQVYDVDEVDGTVFYAMEFLHGRDVRQIVRRLHTRKARMPLEQALGIVIPICGALHYAHEMVGAAGEPLGIVHRDVSPHNVFVRFDGVVKVIDFGIAKATSRLDRTATGVLRGKFGYMSPEQCLSQPLDRRSDVFSIAIVLYELTTGRRLYDGASEYVILKRIVETDPEPPSVKDPSYPAELERIVIKALGRDRARRHASAEELQLELEAFARSAGLDTSGRSLARFMAALFEEEVAAWRDAQRTGGLFVPPSTAETDDDIETEPRPLALPPFPMGAVAAHDDTKSASVTETLAPAPRRSSAGRLGLLVGLPVVAAAAGIWVARAWPDHPPPVVEPAQTAPAAPPSPEPTAAPVDAGEPASSASATPPPARPRTPIPSRRKPASTSKPARPDPDAPLPH